MAFYSILFPALEDEARARNHPWLTERADDKKSEKYMMRGNKIVLAPQGSKQGAPLCPGLYLDLNLDQIIDSVLCHEADEELRELFYHFCPDEAMVRYRQEVMSALEDAETGNAFRAFLHAMAKAGRLLAYGRQAHHPNQRDKYVLDGTAAYCNAIRQLLDQTSGLSIQSQGLMRFLDAAGAYIKEERFVRQEERALRAKSALERISYGLRVGRGVLHVDFEADTADYAQALHQCFDMKARWGTGPDEKQMEILPFRQVELSPLEALIMKALAEKHPKAFRDVREAAEEAVILPEPFIGRFVKEMRFYFLYLDLMIKLRGSGHAFAYPEITRKGEVFLGGAYDLALAISAGTVVPNDFILTEEEKGTVITGANQGGKTTFLRSIGQAAVLAALGLPVPCECACLPLYNAIFSQFTQAEDATADNGKLKEELIRLRPILQGAGRGSLVILNELFSSATAQDALDMAEHALELLMGAGAHTLCVTHIDGLRLRHAVSMVAQVQKADGKRLYKIMRAEADGQAHVGEIALKYHLTAEKIKERIAHGI